MNWMCYDGLNILQKVWERKREKKECRTVRMRIKVKKNKIKWRWNIFSLMCTIMIDRRDKKSVHILSQKTSKKSNNFKLNFMSCWASSFLSNASNNPKTSQTEMDNQWLFYSYWTNEKWSRANSRYQFE